jgi:hypothetical protein
MEETARHLQETVAHAARLMKTITEKEASKKEKQGKWSKKEIIGHLIDSAGNNQQKFVRLMETPTLSFVAYNQDYWVTAQRYCYADWIELITLWELANMHLAHIIKYTMPNRLHHEISIDGKGPYTLEFIMKDYVEHLKHHLKQILPDAGIDSKFENIYAS